MTRFFSILLLFGTVLSGCFMGDEGDQINVTDRYYLRSNGPGDTYHLGFYDDVGYGVGIFNRQITEAGYNDDYLIFKVYDGHYIVKLIEKGDHRMAEESIEGSMNEVSFNQRKSELGISELEFTKTFTRQ